MKDDYLNPKVSAYSWIGKEYISWVIFSFLKVSEQKRNQTTEERASFPIAVEVVVIKSWVGFLIEQWVVFG